MGQETALHIIPDIKRLNRHASIVEHVLFLSFLAKAVRSVKHTNLELFVNFRVRLETGDCDVYSMSLTLDTSLFYKFASDLFMIEPLSFLLDFLNLVYK